MSPWTGSIAGGSGETFVNLGLATSMERNSETSVTMISFAKDHYVMVEETPEQIVAHLD